MVVYIRVHCCSKENFCLICVRKSLRSLVFISKSLFYEKLHYKLRKTIESLLQP
jgi:hypothetical protein